MHFEDVKDETYPILLQFMHYYLDEIYETVGPLKMDMYGNYIYEGMELYLDNPSLKALFIKEGEVYKGFILLNSGRYAPKGYDFTIHEFYIAKPYRHQGLAAAALSKLFTYYRGKYYVMQPERHNAAIRFWHHIYDRYGISYVEKRSFIDDIWYIAQTFLIV